MAGSIESIKLLEELIAQAGCRVRGSNGPLEAVWLGGVQVKRLVHQETDKKINGPFPKENQSLQVVNIISKEGD